MSLPFEVEMSVKAEITEFFDEPSSTFSYVVKDPDSNSCAVIDSVMDINYPVGRLTFESADVIIAHIKDNDLELQWILETHVHADHLSAAPYIKEQIGGKIGIGHNITIVQETFGKIFNAGTEFQRDGSQFDKLLKDGDVLQIGGLAVNVLHTPGHTPACMTFVIGDAAFLGDTLFMPDGGSARADFPGGDAHDLYNSIQRILSMPDDTRLFMCHDYAPGGRQVAFLTTVKEQRDNNIHVGGGTSEDDYVAMRKKRDSSLAAPKFILPSLQINMRAGNFPPEEDNGTAYLKVPINKLGS